MTASKRFAAPAGIWGTTGLLAVISTLAALPTASACTTVCLSRGEQLIVAKSYDYHVGHGLTVLNRRQVAKQALVLDTRLRPASWSSRYASVTFNQYGRELPLGGMNEQGLVVEIMWLDQTRHPAPVLDRDTVNELQLIQLLLDRCATVPEALAALRSLQVVPVYAKVHYMFCDRQGRCAVLEHLDGQRVIHAGKRLPVRALTNHPYAASLRALRRHRGFGGRAPLPRDKGSLARFTRAATHSRGFAQISKLHDVTRAFHILKDVQNGDYTKWQIVYEPAAGRVHFRDARDKAHATIDLRRHAQGCSEPVRVMDLLGTLGGAKGALLPYSLELNQTLVRKSFAELGARLPRLVLDQLARYPQSTRCETIPAGGGVHRKAPPDPSPDRKQDAPTPPNNAASGKPHQ